MGLWIALAVVGVLLLGGGVFALLRGGGDDSTDSSDVAGDDAVSTGEDLGAADRDDADDTGDDEAGGDASSATTDPADCTPLTVWAAPQVAAAVEQAADRASDDCLSYEVVSKADASAQSELQTGDLPDAWIPGSAAWPVLMSEAGVELEVGETIASTPVVLAAAPPVVDALEGMGIGAAITWGELVEQYQQLAASGEAPVTLRLGDPRHDPATMALLSSTAERPGGWAQDGPGRGVLVVLAQSAIQDDPVSGIEGDPAGMVPATEQQVASAGADGQQLRGLTVQDGLGVVQIPFVRVGDDGSQAAADALEEQLTSEEGAADLQQIWLRPGADGAAPQVDGMPEVSSQAAPADPGVVAQAAATWGVLAPQSRILTLVDISGSMEAEVGDTTRIDLTREAALAGLSVLPDGTAIGLWYFATALEDDDQDHTEVIPLRALGEEVEDGLTQRQQLMSVAGDLGLDSLTGDTGLHDSLWAAYQHMQQDETPDSVSSVLLLTDGINDDSTGGLSEDEVVDLLTEARDSGDRPVTVVLIGMGPDPDEAALDRLAEAAGGESLVLRDPRELPQVFVDIVARRAG